MLKSSKHAGLLLIRVAFREQELLCNVGDTWICEIKK